MPVQCGDFPNICLGLLPYFLGVPQVLAERGFGTQVLDGWSRMVEHLMSMVSGGLGYSKKPGPQDIHICHMFMFFITVFSTKCFVAFSDMTRKKGDESN